MKGRLPPPLPTMTLNWLARTVARMLIWQSSLGLVLELLDIYLHSYKLKEPIMSLYTFPILVSGSMSTISLTLSSLLSRFSDRIEAATAVRSSGGGSPKKYQHQIINSHDNFCSYVANIYSSPHVNLNYDFPLHEWSAMGGSGRGGRAGVVQLTG